MLNTFYAYPWCEGYVSLRDGDCSSNSKGDILMSIYSDLESAFFNVNNEYCEALKTYNIEKKRNSQSHRTTAEIAACLERKSATLKVKKRAIRQRRSKFQINRPGLLLKMLASGVEHVCAAPGCNETERLHVDHIIPLSKGGCDDLDNLQFLCGPHNSSKGDREKWRSK